MKTEEDEYYVLFSVNKDGDKEVYPLTITGEYKKALGRKVADDVITKHIFKVTDIKKRPNYKLVRYESPTAGDLAIQKFLG